MKKVLWLPAVFLLLVSTLPISHAVGDTQEKQTIVVVTKDDVSVYVTASAGAEIDEAEIALIVEENQLTGGEAIEFYSHEEYPAIVNRTHPKQIVIFTFAIAIPVVLCGAGIYWIIWKKISRKNYN